MKDTNISTLSSVDTKTIQNMKMPVELALFESDIMLSDSHDSSVLYLNCLNETLFMTLARRDRKMILNQDKS